MEAILPETRYGGRKAAGADDGVAFLREYLETAVVRLQSLAERLEQPGTDPRAVAGELNALAQELWQALGTESDSDEAGAEPLHRAR